MSLSSLLREKLIEPVLRAQGTPESIARGGSIGVWVALTPTVGIQMLLVAGLAVPLRANLPVAMAMVWITNPVTVIPIYFSFYWLGTLLMGLPNQGYRAVATILRDSIHMVESQGLLMAVEKLGREVLVPMTLGSLVIASLVAVPTYHGLLWAGRRRLERKLLTGLEHGDLRIVEAGIEKRPSEAPLGADGQPLPHPEDRAP